MAPIDAATTAASVGGPNLLPDLAQSRATFRRVEPESHIIRSDLDRDCRQVDP